MATLSLSFPDDEGVPGSTLPYTYVFNETINFGNIVFNTNIGNINNVYFDFKRAKYTPASQILYIEEGIMSYSVIDGPFLNYGTINGYYISFDYNLYYDVRLYGTVTLRTTDTQGYVVETPTFVSGKAKRVSSNIIDPIVKRMLQNDGGFAGSRRYKISHCIINNYKDMSKTCYFH